MRKFKTGDLCVVTDIGPNDTYFGEKEKLIGKRFIFQWYNHLPNKKEDDEFINCMLYFADEFEDPGHRLHRAIYFYEAKLEKVV